MAEWIKILAAKLEVYPWEALDGRREVTLDSCSLSDEHLSHGTYVQVYAHTK